MELKKGDRVLYSYDRDELPCELIICAYSSENDSTFLAEPKHFELSSVHFKRRILKRLNPRYSHEELKKLLVPGAKVVYGKPNTYRAVKLSIYDADLGWCIGERGNTIYTFKDWAIKAIFPAKTKPAEYTLENIRKAVYELLGPGMDSKIRSELVLIIEQFTPTAPTTLSNIKPSDYQAFMEAINNTYNKYRTEKEKRAVDETIQMFDRLACNMSEMNFTPYSGSNNTTKMDNRKPFDFEAWRKGAEVETRNGLKVTNLTYFSEVCNINGDCLSGIVDGKLVSWRKNGFYSMVATHTDLVMSAPKPKWRAIMRRLNGAFILTAEFPSEEAVKIYAGRFASKLITVFSYEEK